MPRGGSRASEGAERAGTALWTASLIVYDELTRPLWRTEGDACRYLRRAWSLASSAATPAPLSPADGLRALGAGTDTPLPGLRRFHSTQSGDMVTALEMGRDPARAERRNVGAFPSRPSNSHPRGGTAAAGLHYSRRVQKVPQRHLTHPLFLLASLAVTGPSRRGDDPASLPRGSLIKDA